MSVTISWSTETFLFEFGVAIGIQKEFTRTNDNTIINEKHVISVRGQIVATGADSTARYKDLALKTLSYVQKVAGGGNHYGTTQMGPLIINVDGSELLNYADVGLQSVSVSEPSEDTAGIHHQEVSITFETFMTPADPASVYKLRSASESLEIKREEDSFSYLANDISSLSPYYAYTIVHNISAEGIVNNKNTREAFEEAYRYVESKKKDSLSVSDKDIFGRPLFSTLNQKTLAVTGNSSIVVDDVQFQQYQEYNKMRTCSSDVVSGSYSISTTFFMSREGSLIDITGNYNRDEAGECSVAVEGTIRGLSTLGPTSVQQNKITQARATYTVLSGDLGVTSPIYQFAESIYNQYQADKIGIGLRTKPNNYSFGENKNAGTITFNITYKVASTAVISILNSITGALVATSTIADINRAGAGHDMDTIVEIPIIGRNSEGPIIQNMNTTKSRSRTVSIDVTLEQRYRTPVNNLVRTECLGIIGGYTPTYSELYTSNFTENWEWMGGKYQATLEWIYKP